MVKKHGKIKEKSSFSSKNSLTKFQQQYTDVFERLSEGELLKYKELQGYEKEEWLKNKRKEYILEKPIRN